MLIVLFLLLQNSMAKNLSEILESLSTSKKKRVLTEKMNSNIAQNKLLFSYEAPYIGMSLSHAKENFESGIEYSLNFSQNINHPFSFKNKKHVNTYFMKASRQRLKHEFHILGLQITSLYHTACISKEVFVSSNSLVSDQEKQLSKLKKLYEVGEISKKTLLFNQLDLAKLRQKIMLNRTEYKRDLSSLQGQLDSIMINDITKLEVLECHDLRLNEKYGGLKST
jgi:outer membrane protein, heavy metal efflux system